MSGSRLLFHAVSSIVPSAARIFTVVFGMGTGVASARIATRQNFQCIPIFSGNPRCSALSNSAIAVSSYENPTETQPLLFILRKEVIQPHLPIQLPCYDFTPVISPAFDGSFFTVRPPASGIADSHGVTGGVYKTRERIHRGILIRDY